MLYHVSRNGQNYGPYTLEDLRRYVASGNILATDMAKSDDMPDWVPVSQVLGLAQSTPMARPPLAAQAYPVSPSIYPDPPNLHWGLVLLLDLLTWAAFGTLWRIVMLGHFGKVGVSGCYLFMFFWNIYLATWMKSVQPDSKAIFYYTVAATLFFLEIVVGTHAQLHPQPGVGWIWTEYRAHSVRYSLLELLGLTTWIVRIIARFTMRAELEQHFNTVEPVGLSLSGVMTFFFGGLYFQYHINRINELKRTARYQGAVI